MSDHEGGDPYPEVNLFKPWWDNGKLPAQPSAAPIHEAQEIAP